MSAYFLKHHHFF